MWRNNRGAFKDATGRWVRYGLANDSKKFGDKIKSSDFIGGRPVLITPEMVGTTILQFTSIEVKDAGWSYKGDEHEAAQKAWIDAVNQRGGYGAFISDPDQLT
jgi:hypothetical protein